ncbi:pyridoxal phosphate-dependent decarboxylase family protein [Catalinimonas niigatensis]|uniref:pyridoxal phosphate-dependent decarboxylase family protein n=1 Tax=Catalinimonas niigatensis TaxID=1397264 RepID=UPI00266610ED|nr:aminotransferase class V-fold PLP-dependent enzyme [Catalinimonas niigatensis]WPP50545.1 aminotransferase class V-fold PLP-dependent enzyme [Catalinimonas niigatensis]
MQSAEEFRKYAHQMVDWIADYYQEIETYPVKAQVKPGDIMQQLPASAPQEGESMQQIFEDFQKIILPGMTHWQNPNFYAYFPANASFPSMLGEMLTTALGAQCMIWETSPAAAELEEQVMHWLRDMLGLPRDFTGVIQDTASTATLCALLTAREKKTAYQSNEQGLHQGKRMRIYCSTETHSSVEKGVKIMGLGRENLVKIPVDEQQSMHVDLLRKAVEQDVELGFVPVCVVAALGTTGTLAFDPLQEIAALCQEYAIWLHVDAAYAGSAFILPEYQHYLKGIEGVDSFVFNPHKWLMTHFDCSAYFVRDCEALINTFSILPEYLKTSSRGKVKDYRDWGVPLGRRFRALKLWFVLRSFGVQGLQNIIRQHISLADELAVLIKKEDDFVLRAQRMNLLAFYYQPTEQLDQESLNDLNQKLMEQLNTSGKLYLTHTKSDGQLWLRMVIGQTYVKRKHVMEVWKVIRETARSIKT